MKKLFTLAIIFISLTLLTYVSNAQPCGIDATINIYGGVTTVSYTADTSSLQAGWSIYAYEWEVNNNIFSTQWAFADWLPQGYNLVCLRVSATNSSTGDSCTSEHCNVFYSTGDAPFPYF